MYWLVFFLSFAVMEPIAWALHKYVMHGLLWTLHEDHHVPHKKRFERNDAFALIFAIPSFLMILFGGLRDLPLLAASGYGIMAYGITYFLVHEAIIHRRFRFLRGRGPYFRALIMAHRQHHRVQTKEGSTSFGMLMVHPKYFKEAFQFQSERKKA